MQNEHPTQPPENPPPGQGIGRGMMYAGWLVLIALLTYVFGVWEENQYNPNQTVASSVNGDQIEVILERNRRGHYVADGTINGTRVTYLLDTGATLVAIPESVARKLNLPKLGKGQANTANGIVDTYYTKLDRLTLGDIEMRNVHASIMPNMDSNEILLGMTVLKHLELIQKGDTLTIRQ